jgi:hypothetical protein
MPDVKLIELTDGRLLRRPDLEMSLDTAGRFLSGPVFISGRDVAVQDVVRVLLTRVGTSPMAPGFGTVIPDLVGSRAPEDVSGQISRDVQSSLGYLASLRAGGDPAEQVAEVVSLSTKLVERTLETRLTVRTSANQTATVVVA